MLVVVVQIRTCHHTAYYCVARYGNSDLKVWPYCPGLVCSGGITSVSLSYSGLAEATRLSEWRCLPVLTRGEANLGNEHQVVQQVLLLASPANWLCEPTESRPPAPRILSRSAHPDGQPLKEHRGTSNPSCNPRYTSLEYHHHHHLLQQQQRQRSGLCLSYSSFS